MKKNLPQVLRLSIFLFFTAFVGLWLTLFMVGCTPKTESPTKSNRVVLYCSVDSVFARPLIKKLEEKTGLEIDAIFDTEATKTAGLANKIRAEKERPRADVFWSSALLQTLLMNDEGLLEDYKSPAAQDLPARFQGTGWAGVGVRGRVIVGRRFTELMSMEPPQFFDFTQKWKIEAISNPQFGTASDWATAYSARHGKDKTLKYFKRLKAHGVQVLPGNGDVAVLSAKGTINCGVTDTDDFLAQKDAQAFSVSPTKRENVVVPGAVSVLKNSPNPENAKKLFDAIVSAENEAALIKEMPGVFSLRHMNEDSNWKSGKQDFAFLKNAPDDDYSKWPQAWRELREPLNEILKK